MNNDKKIMIATVVGMVIVGAALSFMRKRREESEAKMTEDSMNKVKDMFKNIDFTK